MERRKLTTQDIDKVRHIEGFPQGRDEDIIALSDPPYYTACPNPFIEDFIREHGTPYDEATDDYHREPFAADVSEGKNDPIYNAHSYHTKVPHKAIMRYILHYTKPGDIVLDGFCGTGMTGVAAQMCAKPDADFKAKVEADMPGVQWGARKAILSDLSPAATFIAYNYNTPVDVHAFEKEAKRILAECEKELGWMYQCRHVVDGKPQLDIEGKPVMGRINYTVWSDVFICSTCGQEVVYWDSAVDWENSVELDTFKCSFCNSDLKKRNIVRASESYYDVDLNDVVQLAKQVPVLIVYSVGKNTFRKEPESFDIKLIQKVTSHKSSYWYPIDELIEGFNTEQPRRSHGINYMHQFYSRRTLVYLSTLLFYAKQSRLPRQMTTLLTGIVNRNAYKSNRFIVNKYNPRGRINGPKTGTLYIPSLCVEQNIGELLRYKIPQLKDMFSIEREDTNIISSQSATDLPQIPSECLDYIFTDPPFGANINYSELNTIWESWLRVYTNSSPEAIVNGVQKKELIDYQELMQSSFAECFRILKPNRWITVEFHNSKNSVWNAIQNAMSKVGFITADVRVLNKQRPSQHQRVAINAVDKDLVINAYKPKSSFAANFVSNAGMPEAAFDFVRQHLEKLPIVVMKGGQIEFIDERQAYLLFDRTVAYHIVNGLSVPLDAPTFYKGLSERFMQRDGMYFLPSQVNEYDTARIKNDLEPVQMELLVTNERSAIAWLYRQLDAQPRTYGELQPQFMQEQRAIARFEALPELQVLLDENFLQDEKGRWYIPDVTKEGDMAKLRNKNLLKEFDGYLATRGKLRLFRLEAIRAGFAKLWDDKNYRLIIDTADRLPESVVQEDDKLLMYYDISLGRV